MGWIAQGWNDLLMNASEFGFKRVVESVEEYGVEKIVIGLPKNMNTEAGPRVEVSCRYGAFRKRLSKFQSSFMMKD